MKKWLTIGGVLMLVAWSPFLWKELTSSPAAKKGRDLPTEDLAPDTEVAAAGTAAAEPEPDPAAEPEAPGAEKSAPGTAAADPNAKPDPSAKPAKPEGAQPGDPEADNPDEEVGEELPPPVQASGPTTVLKAAFDTQPRDALWAKDTEARITGMFTGDVPIEMLQNASCRKAVCRLQLRWTRDRAEAYVSIYQSLHQEFGPEVGVEPIGQPDAEDGHQQVDVYVARKGYTVADLAK
jgi:hypothetical protein